MARTIPQTDVLVILMGAPHASDQTTSVLRLVQAMLERGGSVQVWACGYATMLTQASLGTRKQRNFADWSAEYPTTPTLIQGMLRTFPDQLYWYGCRFCSDDRGADHHLPEVTMRGPSAYAANFGAADKTLMVGVI